MTWRRWLRTRSCFPGLATTLTLRTQPPCLPWPAGSDLRFPTALRELASASPRAHSTAGTSAGKTGTARDRQFWHAGHRCEDGEGIGRDEWRLTMTTSAHRRVQLPSGRPVLVGVIYTVTVLFLLAACGTENGDVSASESGT